MIVALIVNRVARNIEENIRKIEKLVTEAALQGAGFIILPETTFTGLINADSPQSDLLLGDSVPGRYTEIISRLSIKYKIYSVFGLFERESSNLYDTAILISPKGRILIKYRRIDQRWRANESDNLFYKEGNKVLSANTPFGKVALMICGDLFNQKCINQCIKLCPDYVIVPMARCFDDGSCDQQRWDNDELPLYIEQVKKNKTTVFITNYLANQELNGGSFGGAFVISGDGKVLKSFPLGMEGILYYNSDKSVEQ
ncbi:MAG: carbon-nitrogen hydrolase family protein [Bacteroidetes bacterium]|nr:MAG: carbon-nitrogen hydrolase family protein [Bacteroidota bacterium]